MPGMPGMPSGVDPSHALSVRISAFDSTLLLQAVVISALLTVGFVVWQVRQLRNDAEHGHGQFGGPLAESTSRRIARIGLALLWMLDGVLQAQPEMPSGLARDVIAPGATSAPAWLHSITTWFAGSWDRFPIQDATAVVWVQIGIGTALLFAPAGRLRRMIALVSLLWALGVWIVGESLGGIFAPSASLEFGAPGAALVYVALSLVVLCNLDASGERRLDRQISRSIGALFIAGGIWQAVPGHGTWATGPSNSLAQMINDMAAVNQPRWLSQLILSTARADSAHAVVVNGIAVVVLISIGATLFTQRRAPRLLGLVLCAVFGLLDWVLVQDLGVFGGLGTDPNSVVPALVLLFSTSWSWVHSNGATAPVEIAKSAPSRGVWWSGTAVSGRALMAIALLAVAAFGSILLATSFVGA